MSKTGGSSLLPISLIALLVIAFAASAAKAQIVPCYDPPEDPCIGKCFLEQYFSDDTYTTVVGEHFENPCPGHENDFYQWGQHTQYQVDTCWTCCNVCAKNRRPAYKQLPILKANLLFPSPHAIAAASRAAGKPCGAS